MTFRRELFLFFLISAVCIGQVNTEKYRTPEEMEGVAGYVELSGNIKTGNTEKTEAGLDGRIDYRTVRTLSFIIFQADYEWISGNRSSDEGLLHIRHVRDFVDSLEFEIFGQVNYNKKLLVQNRELIGVGLRYRLFDFANSDIHIGTAYMFEHENYDLEDAAAHPDVHTVSRWSNYLTFYFSKEKNISIGSVLYYQPAFNDFNDYRILNENHFSFGLSKNLSFAVLFKLRYDSKPPDTVKDTDTETRVGLAFKF